MSSISSEKDICTIKMGLNADWKVKGGLKTKEMKELPSFLALHSSSGISSGSLEISSLADASIASAWAASHALLWKEKRKHEW